MNIPAVAVASLAYPSVPTRTSVALRSIASYLSLPGHRPPPTPPRAPSTFSTTTQRLRLDGSLHRHMISSSSSSTSNQDGSMYRNRGGDTSAGGVYRESRRNYDDDDGKSIVVREARILALSDPNDPNNEPLYSGTLPSGCTLVGVGSSLGDIVRREDDGMEEYGGDSMTTDPHLDPNVIFVSHPRPRESLVELLDAYPAVEWIHARSAGVDHIVSDVLSERYSNVRMTNARGIFSSSLAEYCMMACSYFARDVPRLMRQKGDVDWTQYPIMELRGATLGIVGYGDIGRACARLAKAYGMVVLGLRRTASSSSSSSSSSPDDPYCDRVYGTDGLHELLSRSDYVLVSAPLTEQTRGLVSREALSRCKPSAVIINVGRGPIIDEAALVEALTNGTIRGAGLDVTTVEPLPGDSPLWKLDNVLLSPHNMDMTRTFMRESTEFFVNENLPRFVRGETLLNPVDKSNGY
ncbi:hypothetical protein ACHAXA_000597 [Cyclostephanos tholiformis]|uniref:D-isomer specific 2-hydroxyacid dehydrogenase NAD-binding domain-containing protein n=1 Tax=Cyclostephanos tholiformis TaxID=382380 RepID=A0ABD3SQX7_9STRA